eukprot:m51a1_g5685 hypothetical protein (90) ;mRNA; f:984841-985110
MVNKRNKKKTAAAADASMGDAKPEAEPSLAPAKRLVAADTIKKKKRQMSRKAKKRHEAAIVKGIDASERRAAREDKLLARQARKLRLRK